MKLTKILPLASFILIATISAQAKKEQSLVTVVEVIAEEIGTKLAEQLLGEWVGPFISVLKTVINVAHDKELRKHFVLSTIDQAALFIENTPELQGYHALVVDENHRHYVQNFTDIVARLRVVYPGESLDDGGFDQKNSDYANKGTYDLWIFGNGSFQLNGDGGFENWAYLGGRLINNATRHVVWP